MATSDLLEDLSVPYILTFTSIDREGNWIRQAQYPELPGCITESESVVEALGELEELRVRIIVGMRRRGERPPRPRPPLRYWPGNSGGLDIDELLNEQLANEVAGTD